MPVVPGRCEQGAGGVHSERFLVAGELAARDVERSRNGSRGRRPGNSDGSKDRTYRGQPSGHGAFPLKLRSIAPLKPRADYPRILPRSASGYGSDLTAPQCDAERGACTSLSELRTQSGAWFEPLRMSLE